MTPAGSERPRMDRFFWLPGQGPDPDALARLRAHFPRPRETMGEAWFMGDERKMFPELLGDIGQLSCRDLQEALEEIASGTSCFGEMGEWTDWYHHLLGPLVPRGHEFHIESLLEYLVTAFIAIHPRDDGAEPYAGFREDALRTLGQCMMEPACWDGNDICVGRFLHRSNRNPARIWGWWDASGDFSASMFFCLKYLPPPLVPDWIDSVFAIPSPHWRAQVLVWLLGAKDVLSGRIGWPSQFEDASVARVRWAWSHCLRPDLAGVQGTLSARDGCLISEAACDAVLRAVRAYFTPGRFLEWLESFDRVPYVRDELTHLPRDFERVYIHPLLSA